MLTVKVLILGELCETTDNIMVVLLILSLVLLAILLIGSLFIFKHYKEEADIASMTWKIDADEIKEIRHGSSTMERQGGKIKKMILKGFTD